MQLITEIIQQVGVLKNLLLPSDNYVTIKKIIL